MKNHRKKTKLKNISCIYQDGTVSKQYLNIFIITKQYINIIRRLRGKKQKLVTLKSLDKICNTLYFIVVTGLLFWYMIYVKKRQIAEIVYRHINCAFKVHTAAQTKALSELVFMWKLNDFGMINETEQH